MAARRPRRSRRLSPAALAALRQRRAEQREPLAALVPPRPVGPRLLREALLGAAIVAVVLGGMSWWNWWQIRDLPAERATVLSSRVDPSRSVECGRDHRREAAVVTSYQVSDPPTGYLPVFTANSCGKPLRRGETVTLVRADGGLVTSVRRYDLRPIDTLWAALVGAAGGAVLMPFRLVVKESDVRRALWQRLRRKSSRGV
ncbi:MAG: hypothetical protein U0Q15_07845 [Kineosporiaceae bacterium]